MSPVSTVVDTFVTVSVHPPTSGRSWQLSYFPKRWFETVIYYTPPGKPVNPDLPREVSWEVKGLQDGQTLVMEPKLQGGAKDRLRGPFRISAPGSNCQSGQAQPGTHPRPRVDSWEYSIVLRDAMGEELARIDPEVIIKEDP